MKALIMILSIILFYSCSGPEVQVSGVWASKEAYSNWKANASEDLVAREAVVDEIRYNALTNSVIISLKNKQLLAPGGEWKITSTKIVGSTARLEIESTSDSKSQAIILVSFQDQDIIYFTLESAKGSLRNELDSSFLLFGPDYLYQKCDRL
jgi:hypothetical protein